jgi:hypothetical protein
MGKIEGGGPCVEGEALDIPTSGPAGHFEGLLDESDLPRQILGQEVVRSR